ncbi:hypothetical protein [Stieleria sp.]|uniref:hypothetical protein n=1 Tax=Stieleria sp. TaxID=2795976 RepID=UPI00356330E7
MIVAEIAHGITRALTLVPLVGQFRSNQLGVFTGSAILLAIATLSIRWIGPTHRRDLLQAGVMWLVLTLAFELLFGRFVVGLSWQQLSADYNLLQGGLMPIGLAVLFVAPWLAAWFRGIRIAT